MLNKSSAFLIAAPQSNSGKTLVSLALMQALVDRGIFVQPFKCGPDYIDTMHHSQVAGRNSHNLDCWMSSKQHIHSIFNRNIPHLGVAMIEGAMGLFDGANKSVGSSADIAKQLKIPVVLVVDAQSMAYSAAPLLYGYRNFDKRVSFAGVIFNKVGSESHYRFLQDAAFDAGIVSLGYIPNDKHLRIESRHLGLHLPHESKQNIKLAAELIEQYVDIDYLLELTQNRRAIAKESFRIKSSKMNIALAHDEAFNFYYQANIDALQSLGNIRFFSPLHDKQIPDADLLWLPGGYPELFAPQLANNSAMRKSIVDFVESNKMVIAECGGMMYLGKEIIDKNKHTEEMCSIFSFSTSFEDSRPCLGYRKIQLDELELRGHEFHYSKLCLNDCQASDIKVSNAKGAAVNTPIFRYRNCWASYLHLYLGEEKKLRQFINQNFQNKA
ncbi:MAG: cobyrinate a,c-diamide synthase [Mangrovibacterium sp.]